jgi:hypothetical protein
MESNPEDPRHFLKNAANISEASCSGRYMRVSIEKVLINIPITGGIGVDYKGKTFTIARVLYSNLWGHLIATDHGKAKMVDSEGIQHSVENDTYNYRNEATVRLSKSRSVSYNFEYPDDTVEGKAKARGWLFFAPLPPSIYPQRFVFRFRTFEAGSIYGRVQDEETLEVVFDFQFRKLLPEVREFVTLDID